MDIDKVIHELQFECMADPLDLDACKVFIKRLHEEKEGKPNILGKLLAYLLTKAENGEFK
jgi:hypothetical protein